SHRPGSSSRRGAPAGDPRWRKVVRCVDEEVRLVVRMQRARVVLRGVLLPPLAVFPMAVGEPRLPLVGAPHHLRLLRWARSRTAGCCAIHGGVTSTGGSDAAGTNGRSGVARSAAPSSSAVTRSR